MTNVIGVIIVSLIVGIVVENIDRYFGTSLKRGWYKLTHPKGVTVPETPRGFIVGRTTEPRLAAAAAVYVAGVVLKWIFTPIGLFGVLGWAIPVILAVFFGFLFGPWVGKVWGRRDSFFKAVDDFQNDPAGQTKGWWGRFVARFDRVAKASEASAGGLAEGAPAAAQAETEPPTVEATSGADAAPPDHSAALNRYLHQGSGKDRNPAV